MTEDIPRCVLCGAELLNDLEFDTGVCGACSESDDGYNAAIVAPSSRKVHAARVSRRDETVNEVQCGQTLPAESKWAVLSRTALDEYAEEYTPCTKCNLRQVAGLFSGITTLKLEEPSAYPFEEQTVVTDGAGHVLAVPAGRFDGTYHYPDPEEPGRPKCGSAGHSSRDDVSYRRIECGQVHADWELCKWCDPNEQPEKSGNDRSVYNALVDADQDDLATDGGQLREPTRVMVDIETLGLDIGSAILSVGAVVFDEEGCGDTFERSISLQSCQDAGLSIDADTLEWWLDQPDAAQEVLTGGDSLATVLKAFQDFWFEHDIDEIWANSPSFDCEQLEFAYEAVGLEEPWAYHHERDFRTLRSLPVGGDHEQQGTEHDALDDALYQARVASTALAELGGDGSDE